MNAFWKNEFKWNWLPGDIRSFPDIVHQGPHTGKLRDIEVSKESTQHHSVISRVEGLNKIQIPKQEFTILGSGLLSLMGIKENNRLDIIISSTVRHKLFDGNGDSIELDGVNILKSNSIKNFSSHGDDDLIKNYSFQINGYNFLEPRFYFNRGDKNLENFFSTESHTHFPFNQLSKDKWVYSKNV